MRRKGHEREGEDRSAFDAFHEHSCDDQQGDFGVIRQLPH